MPIPRSTARRGALASALAGLALAGTLLGSTAASAADATPGAKAPGAEGAGVHQAKLVCGRAHKVDARVGRALARLSGPVGEIGSIAHLQKRVDVAAKAGHTAIETYLNDRLTARKALVGTLTTRQTDLGQVESWCAAHDNGAS